MQDLVLTPTDFVALLNQTLEFAYPVVVIEGELHDFRVSKGRWVYFSLKDDDSTVKFFGTVYMLPGPLEDGMMVKVTGTPRLHNRFGFSVNISSIVPAGEGALKKASDLLLAKLQAEGLFAEERKRSLPAVPSRIGLITAANSAAHTDFIKIINARWGGVQIIFIDVYVQGDQAPLQIIAAIEHLNKLSQTVEVVVITRGGGGLDDLAAFSDERVVRAVAASRIPTLIAVGHEKDVSLAELAADKRASTPSNAAEILVPDKKHELALLENYKSRLGQLIDLLTESERDNLQSHHELLSGWFSDYFSTESQNLVNSRRLLEIFNPQSALKRGYAIVKKGGSNITSASKLKKGDKLNLYMADGLVYSKVEKVSLNG